MKIRIKGNSVRLRLGQSEVSYLGEHGILEESTMFADSVFIYRLCHASTEKKIRATFTGGVISVLLPTESFEKFVNTQVIGCEGEMIINDKEVLYILVEKDFKCLDTTFEDQSDNYPNPLTEEYGK
ncbi:MAG: hypothetical protein ABI772_00660 [Bacteroidota bacterium]